MTYAGGGLKVVGHGSEKALDFRWFLVILLRN